MRRLALAVLIGVLGCVHRTPREARLARDVTPLPPLPSSSIAALLEHVRELGLSDAQIDGLGELERKLDQMNVALRQQAATEGAAREPAPAKSDPAPTGGGMGRGGLRGGGRRGGGRRRAESSEGSPRAERPTLEDRLDANDTQIFLQAEELLDEAQKPRAREIASAYREQLYERRNGVTVSGE